ncbi:MAG: efflux RND transporter periplasmic adaptor subunit, partial [Paludibacteraceae bacterium]|nr:efflux RND transporter periplasmic adaptor subunit [Paludibacteraceae bacterium]
INVLKTLISIPEAYFPRVKQGMKLELISDIYPDKKFPAVIETIYPTIDAATHTFQCKVRIPNGTNLLRPGMYIHTTVPVGKSEALLVPYQAVLKLTGSNERFLFINEGGYAKRIAVTLGDRFDTKIEVIAEEDLKGKELVVQGQNRLVDGIGLEIISDVQNVNASTDSLTSETKQDTIVK